MGSRATVTAPVINAPPSPREWVGIGSNAVSRSSPRTVLASHPAEATLTGGMPLAGSSTRSMTSTVSPSSQPRAMAARRCEATPPQNTGHGLPSTRLNRPAPVPVRANEAATSASSYSRETVRLIRASWPASSRASTKLGRSTMVVTGGSYDTQVSPGPSEFPTQSGRWIWAWWSTEATSTPRR